MQLCGNPAPKVTRGNNSSPTNASSPSTTTNSLQTAHISSPIPMNISILPTPVKRGTAQKHQHHPIPLVPKSSASTPRILIKLSGSVIATVRVESNVGRRPNIHWIMDEGGMTSMLMSKIVPGRGMHIWTRTLRRLSASRGRKRKGPKNTSDQKTRWSWSRVRVTMRGRRNCLTVLLDLLNSLNSWWLLKYVLIFEFYRLNAERPLTIAPPGETRSRTPSFTGWKSFCWWQVPTEHASHRPRTLSYFKRSYLKQIHAFSRPTPFSSLILGRSSST